jgi:hypothetical protein
MSHTRSVQRNFGLRLSEDTYFIGVTPQREIGGLARLAARDPLPAHVVYPTGYRFRSFVAPIFDHLDGHAEVISLVQGPVLGRYGRSQELSVGLEIKVERRFAANCFAALVFRQAWAANQEDAFVARVLPRDEWADNTRPGLTVLFREPQRIGGLQRLLAAIVGFPGDGWPIDGFTAVPAGHGRVGLVIGLRYVFLPEISVRWDTALRQQLAADVEEVEIMLLDQATKIGRMCRALADDPLVEAAWLDWFDVIVAGMEDYAEVVAALEAAADMPDDPTAMSRKRFSDLLSLSSGAVLQRRIALLTGALPAAAVA